MLKTELVKSDLRIHGWHLEKIGAELQLMELKLAPFSAV